ncbi:hypothetical protein DNTS_027656 [Danionella cerebrum]|uniref:MHD domain-containing protein n=1 Tax=Danionella cerebrum TaxID=2873325 RepID=A0A553QG67_9TELE|nr:hypothetical protein DNTS_027656 [Danionella translucida]
MCSTKAPAHWVTFEDEGTVSCQTTLCFSTVNPTPSLVPQHICSSTSNSVPRPSGQKLALGSLGKENWRVSTVVESPSVDSMRVCLPPEQPDSNNRPSVEALQDKQSSVPLQQPGGVGLFRGDTAHKRGSWSSSSDSDSTPSVPRFFIRPEDGSKPRLERVPFSDPYVCNEIDLLSLNDSQVSLQENCPEEPCGRAESSDATPGLGNPETSFLPKGLLLGRQQHGWPLLLRIPERKSRMCSRHWGHVYLRLMPGALLQLFYERGLDRPFRELQLSGHCSISGPSLERRSPGPGLTTLKLERLWYTERKRLHSRPSVTYEARAEQLLKLGSSDAEALLDLRRALEDQLLALKIPQTFLQRYQRPELSVIMSEHVWTLLGADGVVLESTTITRVHCLAFLNGPVRCFLALAPGNSDQAGLAVAERRVHECVLESEDPRVLWFCPPDGCRVELLRLCWPPAPPVPISVRGQACLKGPLLWLRIHLNTLGPMCERLELRVPLPTPPVGPEMFLRKGCLGLPLELVGSLKVSLGSVRYEEALGALVWSIGRLPARNTAPGVPQSLLFISTLEQQHFSDWSALFTLEWDLEEVLAPSYVLGVESDQQPRRRLSRRRTHHCQVQMEKQMMADEEHAL